jgi:hypothetical protein
MAIKHLKNSAVADSGDNALVQPSDWNGDHPIDGGFDFPVETVEAPSTDRVRLFGRNVGGRVMPAFREPFGLDSATQPSISRNKVALWLAAGNSTTATQVGMAANTQGTATAASVAATNIHTAMRRLDYLVTTAATGATAFLSHSGITTNQFFRGVPGTRLGGFHFVARFGGATGMATSTHRFFAGMGNPTSTPMGDVDPKTMPNIIGVGYGSADANWKLMHRRGNNTATEIDLGTSFPRQTADRSKTYELALFAAPGASSVFYEFVDLETGAVATGEITSNLPDPTTLIRWLIKASVGGTNSVIGISVVSAYIETDY